MDKLVYLIDRTAGVTHDDFVRQYLDVHAVLAMRVLRLLDGYTVNFVHDTGPGAPDSITEIWTRDRAAFSDTVRNFTSPAAVDELLEEERLFIASIQRYVVEERLVRGDWPSGPVGACTPGSKRISLYEGDAGPPPGPGVGRVVEQRVQEVLTPGAPPVGLFVCEWAASPDAFDPVPVPSYLTSEYRQRDARS